MKKIIVIVAILAVVAGGAGVAIWWHLRQSTPDRLLMRAGLAIRGDQFNRALGLIDEYLAKRPGSWRGYSLRAEAYMQMRRFDDAREALAKAVELEPDEVKLRLRMAETYSYEGRLALTKKLDSKAAKVAVDQFEKACELIQQIKAKEGQPALDVRESLGTHQMYLAAGHEELQRCLEAEALAAQARRRTQEAERFRLEGVNAGKAATKAKKAAVDTLLDVVRNDPSRQKAAETLVKLCVNLADEASLEKAKKAIEAAKDPAPIAMTMLLMRELDPLAGGEGAGPVNQQQLARAAKILDGILARHPGKLQVKLARAQFSLRMSRLPGDAEFQKAREACEQILADNKAYWPAHLMMARILIQEDKLQEAEKLLEPLTVQPPTAGNPEVHFVYGLAVAMQGKKDRTTAAMRALEKLASVARAGRARLRRAELALLVGDLQAARMLCTPRKGQSWSAPEALLWCKALLGLGRPGASEKPAEELAKKNPNWAEAQYTCAQAKAALGKTNEARALLAKVVGMDPGHANARRMLVRLGLAAGSRREQAAGNESDPAKKKALAGEATALYEAAFQDAETLRRLRPKEPAALSLYVRAATLADKGKPREALRQAVTDHAKSPAMLMAAAEIYDRSLGEPEQALRLVRQAAEIEATGKAELLARSRALAHLKRYAEADAVLDGMLEADPSQADVTFELASLYLRREQVLQAIDKLQSAVALDPKNPSYRARLAEAHMQIGDLQAARKVVKQDASGHQALKFLELRLDMMLGEKFDKEKISQYLPAEEETDLALAVTYFRTEQYGRCIQTCQEGLREDPTNDRLRLVRARAYLRSGRRNEGLKDLETVLKGNPKNVLNYLELGRELVQEGTTDEVVGRLKALPGTRAELLRLTRGYLHLLKRDWQKAEGEFRTLAEDQTAPEHTRLQARRLLIQALVRTQKVDDAIAELDRLAAIELWHNRSMLIKASLLIDQQKLREARDVLAQLRKRAYAAKPPGAAAGGAARAVDKELLRDVAAVYMRARLADEALAICSDLQRRFPHDSANYVLGASILETTNRLPEAIKSYRKAVECDPGNLAVYRRLARALDQQSRPLEVLSVLKEMQDVGEAGLTQSLFAQGMVLAGWGLQEQASRRFGQLANLRYGATPAVKLGLGRAALLLGQHDRAASVLRGIPRYAGQYLVGQRLLVEAERSLPAKLPMLAKLRKQWPKDPIFLVQEMRALAGLKREAEAVRAYRDFMENAPKQMPAAGSYSELALRVLLSRREFTAAADLADQIAAKAGPRNRARWRLYALLLAMADRPQAAGKHLPAPAEALAIQAALGACLAAATQDDAGAATWYARFNETKKQRQAPAGRIFETMDFLTAVAVGDTATARRLSEGAKIFSFGTGPLKDLLAGDAPARRAEAARLLMCYVAAELRLPQAASAWAMGLLKARPTCQWAATVVEQTGKGTALYAEYLRQIDPDYERRDRPLLRNLYADLVKRVEPKDSLLHRVLRANHLMLTERFEEAAKVFAEAAKASGNDPRLLVAQAMAVENGGDFAKAADLYRLAWEQGRNPVAANNAAYTLTQAFATDKAKLAEARKMARVAVEARPNDPSFRDTLGWVAYLEGRFDEAAKEFRRGIRNYRDLVEAHYHLGMTETALGHNNFARWHLTAAVNIGRRWQAEGRELSKGAQRAIQQAKDAMARTGPGA